MTLKKLLLTLLLFLALLAPSIAAVNRGVCKGVLIIDKFARGGLTVAQTKTKYRKYFRDVIKFYDAHFNLDINLAYLYVEPGATSFSGQRDSIKLLQDFTSSVARKEFGTSMPGNACFYHLITGRQLVAPVVGRAYVTAACSASATGLTMDKSGVDPAEQVIRIMIHELGHTFSGEHPDFYTSKNYYSCSTNENREPLRILRSSSDYNVTDELSSPSSLISSNNSFDNCGLDHIDEDENENDLIVEDRIVAKDDDGYMDINEDISLEDYEAANRAAATQYAYLNPNAFISSCARRTILASLSSFQCLWTNNNFAHNAIFYRNADFSGASRIIAARRGKGKNVCYNLGTFAAQASSFKLNGSVNKARIYNKQDCKGSAKTITRNLDSMGPNWNDQIRSVKFFA